MSRTLRTLAAVVLTVLFLTSPVLAASPALPNGATSLWRSAWHWLVELLLPGDAGGGIDPDGGRPQPGPNVDAGVTIDPDGLRTAGVSPGVKREGTPGSVR